MADASGTMTFADALRGDRGGSESAEPERNEGQTQESHQEASRGAQDGRQPEGGGQSPQSEEGRQEIAGEASQSQAQGQERAEPHRGDAMAPAWRQAEIKARREEERQQREADRRRMQDLERQNEEYRRYYQQQQADRQRKQAEADFLKNDLWSSQDPNAHIGQIADHRFQAGFQQMAEPLQKQIIGYFEQKRQEDRLSDSQEAAVEKHGQEEVDAAVKWMGQLIQTDPRGQALHQSVMQHRRPYVELMRLYAEDRQRAEIGPDLNAYRQRYADELLKDPAFLGRALEAHRSMATPVQTGVPGRAAQQQRGSLPSLNRQTSAQDNAAEMSPQDAFQTALATGGRMPRG